jgi:hypothetical protein
MSFPERGTETPTSKQLAETASRYFIRASKDRPASVIAQAATIAFLAVDNGAYLPNLREALLKDSQQIERIRKLAEAKHRKTPNGPLPITREDIEHVIRVDFSFAINMIDILGIDDIRYLAGERYFQEKENGGSAEEREFRMRETFFRMIAVPPQFIRGQ